MPGQHSAGAARMRATGMVCRLAAAMAAVALTGHGTAGADDAYLRLGFGIDRTVETEFMDRDCNSETPKALYGCGVSEYDDKTHRSAGDFGTLPVLEMGLGYAVTPALRLEAIVEYRPDFTFKGNANFPNAGARQPVSADLASMSGMVAAFVDLEELGAPRIGPFAPFIGGGVGIARNRIGETRMVFPKTMTIVPGASSTDVAWMATAGLETALSERATLGIAWRYTDLGTVETGRDTARVVWHDAGRDPLDIDVDVTRAELRSHGIRLSLRYTF